MSPAIIGLAVLAAILFSGWIVIDKVVGPAMVRQEGGPANFRRLKLLVLISDAALLVLVWTLGVADILGDAVLNIIGGA